MEGGADSGTSLKRRMVRQFLDVVPITLLVGGVYACLRWHRLRRNGKGFLQWREILQLLMVCYLTGLCNLVLLPANLWRGIWYFVRWGWFGTEVAPLFSGGFNLVPTAVKWLRGELTAGRWVCTMLAGNLLMFLPLGLGLALLREKRKKWSIWALAFLLPLGIELFQPIVGRSFDIDDLLLNAAGILVGYWVGAFIRRRWEKEHCGD